MARPGSPSVALFDEAHGQGNWAQTGFPSREIDGNLQGLARLLSQAGWRCHGHRRGPLAPDPREVRLVVIPPPTGEYDATREVWRPSPHSRFSPLEIVRLHRFVAAGGRLLLFGYRFGDSFLASNLGELTASFGCLLHDDAVVDTRRLARLYPLSGDFQTGPDSVVPPWARPGIRTLRWRSMATFSILPRAQAFPVVLSPGGACPAYNRRHRSVSFRSQPIAVAGHLGRGRFLFLGGPHAFETGPTGLLHVADNRRLVENCLGWLQGESSPAGRGDDPVEATVEGDPWREYSELDAESASPGALLTLERALRHSQTFRALPRWKWDGRE